MFITKITKMATNGKTIEVAYVADKKTKKECFDKVLVSRRSCA